MEDVSQSENSYLGVKAAIFESVFRVVSIDALRPLAVC